MGTGIGAVLREARETQQRSLEDVAVQLRVRVAQLHALEEERFDTFGGEVYAKGFLKNYAQELGVDPRPLLDAYRQEYGTDELAPAGLVGTVQQPRRQRAAPPAWIAWVLVSVLVLAGLAYLGVQGAGLFPASTTPDDVAGTPPPPAQQPDGEDPSPGDPGGEDPAAPDDGEPGPPDPEPEPEPEGVDLLLAFEENVWLRVVADGSLLFEQTVQAGETRRFQAEQEIEVRFGNAAGVRAELNGEDLGAQGGRGQVVTVQFTPSGASAL